MKRILLLPILAMLMLAGSMEASAKAGGGRPPFQEGDNILGVGIGVGNVYTYYSGSTYLPAFLATFDHGLINDAGPGNIGIGGIVAFQGSRYEYPNGRKRTETNFWAGVRGTYHLTILADKNNKFDPYGGVTVGIRARTLNDDNFGNTSSVEPHVGPFVGARYNFAPTFGAWTELGYDIAFLKLGINFNF